MLISVINTVGAGLAPTVQTISTNDRIRPNGRWQGAPAGRARVKYMEIISPKPIPQHQRTYPTEGRCLSPNFDVTEPPPDGGGGKNAVFDGGREKTNKKQR